MAKARISWELAQQGAHFSEFDTGMISGKILASLVAFVPAAGDAYGRIHMDMPMMVARRRQ